MSGPQKLFWMGVPIEDVGQDVLDCAHKETLDRVRHWRSNPPFTEVSLQCASNDTSKYALVLVEMHRRGLPCDAYEAFRE